MARVGGRVAIMTNSWSPFFQLNKYVNFLLPGPGIPSCAERLESIQRLLDLPQPAFSPRKKRGRAFHYDRSCHFITLFNRLFAEPNVAVIFLLSPLLLGAPSTPTTPKLLEQQEMLFKKKKAEREENLIETVVDFFQQISPQLLSKHANEIFQQDLKSGGVNAEAK